MIADQIVRDQVLDITRSFLVQAPAGSGKTSLLVQRFLSLLAKVQQAPEEILALTFTRKAAAEMRDRIISALQLGLQESPADNDYKYKLWLLAQPVLLRDRQESWDLIDNPARLKIQTIDALCSSITTQMPIMSQFGSQPQIESKPAILYQKAVDLLLQETDHASSWQKELNNLLAHLDNDRIKIKKLLVSMLAVREQWLPIVIGDLSQQETRQILEQSLAISIEEELSGLIADIPLDLDFNLLPEIDDTLESWLVVTDILMTQDNEWRRTVTEKQGFPAPSKAKNSQEKERLKANKDAMLLMLQRLNNHDLFKQKLIAITKLPPATYTDSQWDMLNALAVVLRILAAQLTIVFKDAGQVDFAAVTLAALSALGSQDSASELALALDCKLCHILVDEFQDTSITQFQLLEKLTINWQPYDNKTLFLVGDPMQSIYRFRKAEVGLFLKAKQYGINAIQLNVVQLTVNFRSTPKIVAWVNKVFSQSFPDVDDITYGAISYMPAQALVQDLSDELLDPAVECHAMDPASEASFIIQTIQDIKTVTPYKSIAILVRAKKHLVHILPALRANNIAYQGVELETLKQRPLVQDLLALTKAILHLDDRIAWLAILRAPWCGLRLADLHTIAQSEQTIWQSLQNEQTVTNLTADGRQRIQNLIVIMATILSQRGRQAIDVQVQTAWKALGGNLCMIDNNAAQEAETYFNLLANLAAKREVFSQGFLEHDLNHLFLQPAAVDSTAVQIMTMHKAKGLEFDVVILPSLAKKTRSDDHKLLLIEKRSFPKDYLLIAPIKAATEQHDPIYKYLAWSETQRQAFEDLRLLYVASTRARERIYCLGEIGVDGPIANSSLAKIWSAIATDFKMSSMLPIATETVRNPAIYRLPSSWYAINMYSPPHITTVDKQVESWQQDWLRLVGIVVHRIFWQLATDGLDNWPAERILKQKPIWQQHLRQLGLSSVYNNQALALIEQAVYNTINDDLGKKILTADHPESYAEWRLTVREYDEFKQLILDRAFLDHDGIFWIVDYKVLNDPTELLQAIEQYTAQILKYTKAVKNLRSELKIRAGLYFPLQTCWHQIL